MTIHAERLETSKIHTAISVIFGADPRKSALADVLAFREQLASGWALLPILADALRDLAESSDGRAMGIDLGSLVASLGTGIGAPDPYECAALIATMAGYRPHGAEGSRVWIVGDGTPQRDSVVHLPRNWCRGVIAAEARFFPPDE